MLFVLLFQYTFMLLFVLLHGLLLRLFFVFLLSYLILFVLGFSEPPIRKMISQQLLIVENTLLGLGLVMIEGDGKV